MFRCGKCGELSSPGEKSVMLVVEMREKVYPFRALAHHWVDHGKHEHRDDPGGRGMEIVREMRVHSRCV